MSNKNNRNLQKKYKASQNQTNPNISITSQQVWNAPLPPPEILNAYNQKVQDAIISGAEEYRRHNIDTEKQVTKTESFTVKTVAITYLASTIILLFLGGIAIILDKPIAGSIMSTVGLAINLMPKVLSRKNNNKQ